MLTPGAMAMVSPFVAAGLEIRVVPTDLLKIQLEDERRVSGCGDIAVSPSSSRPDAARSIARVLEERNHHTPLQAGSLA